MNPVNNGINYHPQLNWYKISAINSITEVCFSPGFFPDVSLIPLDFLQERALEEQLQALGVEDEVQDAI